jgi:hypothetical protein
VARVVKYQQRFIGYKVITKSAVKMICEKYNLKLSAIGLYNGFIPKKNLNETLQFKQRFQEYAVDSPYRSVPGEYDDIVFEKQSDAAEFCNKHNKRFISRWRNAFSKFKSYQVEGEFYICAPSHLLQLSSNQVIKDGFEVVQDDPVILFVPYSDARGISGRNDVMVIVTAWGDEAKDVNIFNEQKN